MNGRSPAFDDHRHPETRTECDERPRLDLVAWHKMKAIALRKRRDDELGFDQREVIADALPRTGTERHVHELRAIRAAGGREALRIEGVGLLPERGQSM